MPKITDLDSVISLDGNDVLPVVSKNNNNEDETMKIAVNAIGTKLLNSNEYGALNTTDKKIIGAINEVNTKASQFDNMTATATGSIATFNNGGDDIPVSEYECEIVAQQASGTPTPVSPLPITGFSQADITVTDNDQISNIYVVSFGQTIYGGRLIYKNGEWSIEATIGYVDLGDLSWIYNSGANSRMVASLTGGKSIPNNEVFSGKCEVYSPDSINNIYGHNTDKTIAYSGVAIWVYDTDYTNATIFQTAMSGKIMIYELATPVIIPITSSTRVKTISGDNNIYSNTGDNTVKYFTKNADSIAELVKAFVL